MTKARVRGPLVAVLAGLLASPQPWAAAQAAPLPPSAATAPPQRGDRCAALAGLRGDHLEIVSARTQAAGVPVAEAAGVRPSARASMSELPAFCRVVGKIRPEPGSDINVEVWLPTDGWDGRLHGAGNGGFAGAIDYLELASGVRAGQAVVGTDTGHRMPGAGWAKGHPELVKDYGWRAIHVSTVAAKQMIAAYYGRGPDRSYFVSCSNGGRQGLMEASRFPEDYDGVVAGAPAAAWTDIAVSAIWTTQALSAPGAAIGPEQLKLLQDRVLSDCDAQDGQVDGLIVDPRLCRVDLDKLACGKAAASQCFSPAQLAALRKIYAGPRDPAGRQAAPRFAPSGGEGFAGGWDMYIAGKPKSPSMDSLTASAFLNDLPPTPIASVQTFDFGRDAVALRTALAGDLDVKPDLRRFFERGGKLILYQGWADAAVPPEATFAFRDAMLRASGPRAKASSTLLMIPGMQHCFAGTGPNTFGQFGAPSVTSRPENNIGAAIQAWVERGRVPDRIEARIAPSPDEVFGAPSSGAEKERLICAEPARAVLRRGADPDRAASYTCRKR